MKDESDFSMKVIELVPRPINDEKCEILDTISVVENVLRRGTIKAIRDIFSRIKERLGFECLSNILLLSEKHREQLIQAWNDRVKDLLQNNDESEPITALGYPSLTENIDFMKLHTSKLNEMAENITEDQRHIHGTCG